MRGRVIVALAAVAVGLVWIGQGVGLIRGSSFMVDDGRWALIGLALVGAGAVLGLSAWRSRPRSPER